MRLPGGAPLELRLDGQAAEAARVEEEADSSGSAWWNRGEAGPGRGGLLWRLGCAGRHLSGWQV